MLLNLALIYVGLFTAVGVHEAGHALAAEATGMGPRRVEVGRGPLLLRRRLGRMWLLVRPLPISGIAAYLPQPPGRPGAAILVHFGGALGNSAAAAGLWLLGVLDPALDELLWPLWGVQLGVGLGNLAPFPYKRGDGSDGMKVLRALRDRGRDWFTPRFAAAMRVVLAPGALLPEPSSDAPELLYQCFRTDARTAAWARRDATDVLRELLGRGRLTALERAVALDQLVSVGLVSDDTGATLAELDRWSLEAAALCPLPAVAVSRGGVLVRLGRTTEAEILLSHASTRPMHIAAQAACRTFLGEAAVARGDAAGAAACFELALAILPDGEDGMRAFVGRRREVATGSASRRHQDDGSAAFDAWAQGGPG